MKRQTACGCVAFDPETTYPVEYQLAGWQAILDNFARHVVALNAPDH